VSGDIVEVKSFDSSQFSANFGFGIAIIIQKSCFFYIDYQSNRLYFGANNRSTFYIPFNLT